jgi:phosphate-selective porin OprO/OprP
MYVDRIRVVSAGVCIFIAATAYGEQTPQLATPAPTPPAEQPAAAPQKPATQPQPDGLNFQIGSFQCPPAECCVGVGYGLTFAKPPEPEVKYPTVRLSGYIHADGGWIHQTSENQAAVGDIQDGLDIRRAVLTGVGQAWDNVRYMVELDFGASGRPSFLDVWLEINELHAGSNLRIGHFRQPIGMDALVSTRELVFLERALPFALVPNRQTGALMHGTAVDNVMSWAVSGFRFPTDAYGGNVGDDGGYGFATRLTALLVEGGDDMRVHIGGAYCFADPSRNAIRYASQPEFAMADTGLAALAPPAPSNGFPAFVDTGAIPTENFSLFGAELAGQFHQLYVQSEVLVSVLSQLGGGSAVFPGAYVQAGYVLTGEVRPYIRNGGVFGRIFPEEPFSFAEGGCGAWELTARASHLDLDDSGINGGTLTDLTFGLNWYLNNFTKIQFNYIRALLDSRVNGESEADIAAVRAQLDF